LLLGAVLETQDEKQQITTEELRDHISSLKEFSYFELDNNDEYSNVKKQAVSKIPL